MSQTPIVAYRRTSSDMEMSSSEEDAPTESLKAISKSTKDLKDTRCLPIDTEEKSRSAERRSSEDDVHRKNGDRKPERRREERREDKERDRRDGDRDRRRDGDEKSRRRRSRSRSPHDRRSKHSPERHRGSPSRRDRRRQSPDRHRRSPNFRSRRLIRKAERIDKLGLELYAEAKPGTVIGQGSGFLNPAARITEQIQKRRMLWQNKKEAAPEQSEPGSSKAWEAATFKGDNDGRVTEKFKRLMGMKGDGQPSGKAASEDNSINQKQEEMFSNMEAQYQVARMATHTHRGIGLGFGTFQVPPR